MTDPEPIQSMKTEEMRMRVERLERTVQDCLCDQAVESGKPDALRAWACVGEVDALVDLKLYRDELERRATERAKEPLTKAKEPYVHTCIAW